MEQRKRKQMVCRVSVNSFTNACVRRSPKSGETSILSTTHHTTLHALIIIAAVSFKTLFSLSLPVYTLQQPLTSMVAMVTGIRRAIFRVDFSFLECTHSCR